MPKSWPKSRPWLLPGDRAMSMARPTLNRARGGRQTRGEAARPRTGQFSASPVLGLRLPMWRSSSWCS